MQRRPFDICGKNVHPNVNCFIACQICKEFPCSCGSNFIFDATCIYCAHCTLCSKDCVECECEFGLEVATKTFQFILDSITRETLDAVNEKLKTLRRPSYLEILMDRRSCQDCEPADTPIPYICSGKECQTLTPTFFKIRCERFFK